MKRKDSLRQRAKKKKVFTSTMYRKASFTFFAIICCLVFLLGRIIFLYVTKGEEYSNAVLSHLSFQGTTVPYERGMITDRNGVALAKSVEVYNVVLDPSVIKSGANNMYVKPTANALQTVFGVDSKEIIDKINDNPDGKYLVVEKGVDYNKVNEFEKLQTEDKNVKGVWFELEYKRTYSYGTLASHVIGYTNAGNVGSYGIEQTYNEYLNGEDGRTYGYYDNELNLVKTNVPAKNGATVTSTIDSFCQTVVEDEIDKFLKQYKVNNIAVVLMNPNTGAIYAMASNRGYDLNNPRGDESLLRMYSQEEVDNMSAEDKGKALNRIWRNYAVCDTYEPGSTFKLITVAAALEENAISYESSYNCGGFKTVGKWHIRCSNRNGHGPLTLTGSIDCSCNVALMDIGFALGKTSFLKYQRFFEYGQKTGIDLPGEAGGILLSENDVDDAALATMSFGQSFNVTMVQMCAAYSSLVNGGYYYRPHVVSQVVDNNGITVYSAEDTLMKLTVSNETSDFMKKATESVVVNGTASRAHVDGYSVGGKTGTAQKGKREDRLFVVSFIGSVPADNPELVSYVVIDQIDDPTYYNSSRLATQMTSDILSRVLAHLGIYPSEGEIDYQVDKFIDESSEGVDMTEGEEGGQDNPNRN